VIVSSHPRNIFCSSFFLVDKNCHVTVCETIHDVVCDVKCFFAWMDGLTDS
jgi:hypothetical protein